MSTNGRNNNTIVEDTGPTIPGPYITPQSESWPLTSGKAKSWTFFWNRESSLQMVMAFLFGTAGVVTITLLAHLRSVHSIELAAGSAVVTDNNICTETALDTLKQGGNAIDATVAAVFCLCVVHFHVAGLGGGGVFLGYNERNKKVLDIIDFQVEAPSLPSNVNVGVPGLVAGLWDIHQRHGLLLWHTLLSPSVNLARSGFVVSPSLERASTCIQPTKSNEALLNLLLSTGTGSNITLPHLADTLQLIADQGPNAFYNGSIADEIVYTVKVANGSLSREDLANYVVKVGVSEKTKFNNYDVIVPASLFSGTLLLNSLDTIQFLDLQSQESLTGDTVYKLGDILFDNLATLSVKEGRAPTAEVGQHSTVVTITDSYHNLVSIVLGMNSLFGSELMTDAGFLLNDFVRNGTVQSVGTPAIAIQRQNLCGRRILTGGGEATSLAQVLTQLIPLLQDTNVSVEAPRFHLGQTPRSIFLENHHEPRLSDETLASLMTKRISMGELSDVEGCLWYDAINTITFTGDHTAPYADSRGNGSAASIVR